MYLKYIRADGFKSFADKTEIEIKPGITCVVGPNGSGKSNIVDAVRWVLGEQSVKALRGDSSMSDIIFSGSKSRKGNNRSIVSLTFDNSDNYLNTEFKEVEIKRVLYKTGENEYYLNNTKVRLKDIIDLFLDTGASKESFNIISQGAVSDVINSKPENRRTIFEEAAGVLKYKKRKEDTLKKINKTKDNIEKVNLLTDELLVTLTPLKEQADKARIYLDYKEQLKKRDVALIANDITTINDEYQSIKSNIDSLNMEINTLSKNYSSDDEELENLKLESIKIDTLIDNKNKDIMLLVNELSDLQSKKQITIERQKYEVDDQKLENNIITLKEDIYNIEGNLKVANKELESDNRDVQTKNLELIDLKKRIEQLDKDRIYHSNIVNALNKEVLQISNKIDILNDNINNDTKLPYAVKSVLNNVRLTGVRGVLSKLIEVPDKYSVAIETALGSNCNVIVVDDEIVAKNAINYLKDNKLGRATFYPLNIIKGRYVDNEIIKDAVNDRGYIGLAVDLIDYDKKYRNIMLNQLGNVIVVDNIDSLNRIGKMVNYKCRVVSLDGDILYSGGAMSGGINKTGKGILSEKKELEDLNHRLNEKQFELNDSNSNLEMLNKNYDTLVISYNEASKEKSVLEGMIEQKNRYVLGLEESLNNKKMELEGTKKVSSKGLQKELDSILEKYYEVLNNKELLEKELTKLKSNKFDITNKINEYEKKYKDFNSNYNSKMNILKNEEIKLGKMDVKLDNLLLVLNETYGMTYEKAKNEYFLEDEAENVRLEVNNLKAKIRDLGEVNTGSIPEYERLNDRYSFLMNQKKDL